jgi:hypothetical protein
MKSSRDWGACSCDCGKNISNGDEITLVDGVMYLAGHENNRRTRTIAIVPSDKPEKQRKAKKKT